MGGQISIYKDGRTPRQVAEQRNIIPNNLIAPCTYELKIKPFSNILWGLRGQGTFVVHLGYNVFEIDRIKKRNVWHKHRGNPRRPMGYHHDIPGIYESYPLLWKPKIYKPFEIVNSWGIEIPRLYKMGFSNNNCGGACFRAGLNNWRRLLHYFPERYNDYEVWELEQQERLGISNTILKQQRNGVTEYITLREFREQEESGAIPQNGSVQEDMFGCLCSY